MALQEPALIWTCLLMECVGGDTSAETSDGFMKMKKHYRQQRSGKKCGEEHMKRIPYVILIATIVKYESVFPHVAKTQIWWQGGRPTQKKKHHKCDNCGESFAKHDTLVLHRQLHIKKDPYTCDVCKRTLPGTTTWRFTYKELLTAVSNHRDLTIVGRCLPNIASCQIILECTRMRSPSDAINVGKRSVFWAF